MKKKIIFVITSFEYYTSYLVTDALKKIKSKYNVYYYVSYEINKNLFRGIKNVTYYKTINKNIFLNQKIFDLNTNKYSKKFSSFLLRKKRFYGLNLNFDKNVSFFIKILKTVNRLIIFFYNELYFIVFKNDFLYNFYINYLNFFKIKDIPLIKFLEKIKPDLILIPSQAQELYADTIVMEANKRNIKTCYLIDNWDNLSSKSIIINKPSHFGVWSEQARTHAIEIQKFYKKDITIIGTPRYDFYLQSRNKKLKSHFNFKYILLLGSFLPSNEDKILKFLDNLLFNKITNNIKIVYRPHPNGLKKYNLKLLNLKKTILDPQLQSRKKIIDLKYYPSLIKNSEIVVGGLTSMILESCIMKKDYICIAHKDKNLLIDPYTAYTKYIHFKQINLLKHVYISNNFDDLKDYLIKFFEKKFIKKKEKIKLDYFIKHNYLYYNKNLLKLVSKII